MKPNIIFDYGNVLVRFDPHDLCACVLRDESDISIVSEVLFDRACWDRLDEGTITDDEVIARSLDRLPARLHDAARQIYAGWYLNTPFIDGMDILVNSLIEEGRHLFLLSNISKGFAAHCREIPHIGALLSRFDGLVLSGTIGLVKPGAGIFRHLLCEYGLDASECVFVDDSEKNVRGAEKVGIAAYLFDSNVTALDNFLHDR